MRCPHAPRPLRRGLLVLLSPDDFVGEHPHEGTREKPGPDTWVSRRVDGAWSAAAVMPSPQGPKRTLTAFEKLEVPVKQGASSGATRYQTWKVRRSPADQPPVARRPGPKVA